MRIVVSTHQVIGKARLIALLERTKQPPGEGLELLELARVQVPSLEHPGKRAAAPAQGASQDSVCTSPVCLDRPDVGESAKLISGFLRFFSYSRSASSSKAKA